MSTQVDERVKGPDVTRMLKRSGVSYRRLDHWTTSGYLRVVESRFNGSGYRRIWQPDEDRVALVMHILVEAGTKPELAAERARKLIEAGEVEIAPGILLTMANFETVVAAVEWFEEDQW